jgi:NAD(P)-dependent dehydrogenase (short-subunit alcohol dehydrogenase family)
MSNFIVITGATRGLGRALADRFVEAGHIVAGCGRSQGHIGELRERYGPPHDFQAVDVRDDPSVAAWGRRLLDRHGPPDLLLNNAAVINASAPLWKVSPAEFDTVIDVNIKGVANVLRHFLPPMVAAKCGLIVNFSSGWGRSTSPEVAPYCATKWAIEGLTQALAQELPEGMAAVAMNPGVIDTDMLRSCFGAEAASYPAAESWSHQAARFILSLKASDNGRSLSVQ